MLYGAPRDRRSSSQRAREHVGVDVDDRHRQSCSAGGSSVSGRIATFVTGPSGPSMASSSRSRAPRPADEAPGRGLLAVAFEHRAELDGPEAGLRRSKGTLDRRSVDRRRELDVVGPRGAGGRKERDDPGRDAGQPRRRLRHRRDLEPLDPRRRLGVQDHLDPDAASLAAQPPLLVRRAARRFRRGIVRRQRAMARPELRECRPAIRQRFVELDVHREQAVRDVVVPAREQPLDRAARGSRLRPRRRPADAPAALGTRIRSASSVSRPTGA